MDFYTNVQVHGGKIFYRGFSNGKPVQKKLDYEPRLYVTTSETNTPFKTIKNIPLKQIDFRNIREARDYLHNYGELNEIYGMRRFEYTWIDENETGEHDSSLVRVARIDIEVNSENGFPEPNVADREIQLIGMKMDSKIHVWGIGDFTTERKDINYKKFDNEIDLLKDFLIFWSSNPPDIITGWNVSGFDVPYMVNRINRVLGETWTKRLSPWCVIFPRNAEIRGNIAPSFAILGIAIMDSIELYIRYCPDGQSRDSYRLDSIGETEGVGRKVDLSEHGNIHTLWRTNFQKYTEYNIQDIELDEKISNKYDMINLALTISYMNKVNYEDVFRQVRMWAAIVDNRLRREGIMLNHGVHHDKQFYSGGFVLEPEIGAYQDIVSFDLTSLYPMTISQYNISPDSMVTKNNLLKILNS